MKDIVERAEVSRQTFYYHFGDVYQLLDWAFQNVMKQLCENPAESWRDRILTAVEYLRSNRVLTMNVYHSLGAEYFGLGLEKAIRPFIAEELQSIEQNLPVTKEDREFAISFFTYGVMGTIIRWLDDGMPENLDRIVNDIHKLLHPSAGDLLGDGHIEKGE